MHSLHRYASILSPLSYRGLVEHHHVLGGVQNVAFPRLLHGFLPSTPLLIATLQFEWLSIGSGTRSDTYRRVSELSKRSAFSRKRRMSSDTSSPENRYFRGKPFSILLFYAETWKRGVRGR